MDLTFYDERTKPKDWSSFTNLKLDEHIDDLTRSRGHLPGVLLLYYIHSGYYVDLAMDICKMPKEIAKQSIERIHKVLVAHARKHKQGLAGSDQEVYEMFKRVVVGKLLTSLKGDSHRLCFDMLAKLDQFEDEESQWTGNPPSEADRLTSRVKWMCKIPLDVPYLIEFETDSDKAKAVTRLVDGFRSLLLLHSYENEVNGEILKKFTSHRHLVAVYSFYKLGEGREGFRELYFSLETQLSLLGLKYEFGEQMEGLVGRFEGTVLREAGRLKEGMGEEGHVAKLLDDSDCGRWQKMVDEGRVEGARGAKVGLAFNTVLMLEMEAELVGAWQAVLLRRVLIETIRSAVFGGEKGLTDWLVEYLANCQTKNWEIVYNSDVFCSILMMFVVFNERKEGEGVRRLLDCCERKWPDKHKRLAVPDLRAEFDLSSNVDSLIPTNPTEGLTHIMKMMDSALQCQNMDLILIVLKLSLTQLQRLKDIGSSLVIGELEEIAEILSYVKHVKHLLLSLPKTGLNASIGETAEKIADLICLQADLDSKLGPFQNCLERMHNQLLGLPMDLFLQGMDVPSDYLEIPSH